MRRIFESPAALLRRSGDLSRTFPSLGPAVAAALAASTLLLAGPGAARAQNPAAAPPDQAPQGPLPPLPATSRPAPPASQPVASSGTTESASATEPSAGCPRETKPGCGCACAQRCCSRACGCDDKPKVSLSVVGLRGSLTRVAAGPASDTAIGAAFAGTVDTYALDGTTHGSMYFALGGGEAGFEGALAGTIDLGYRIDVARTHGPFGRIGFDGRIQGNDLLFFSLLELPRITLGWQYLEGKTVFEAGLRGGPIITGRYKPGDEGRRSLSRSLEWGGFVAMQYDFLRLDVSAMRIEARQTLNGEPVDIGRAQLCGVGGKLGVCVDGMLFRGDADMGAAAGGVRSATSSYLGLTIGVAGW